MLWFAGQIQPLPAVVFPIQEAPNALRQLSAAKHIGKVVVRVPSDLPTPEQAPGRWIISGGLGALGSLSVQWLVRQGMLCMQNIQKHASFSFPPALTCLMCMVQTCCFLYLEATRAYKHGWRGSDMQVSDR